MSLSSSSTSSLSSSGTNSILVSLINQSSETIDDKLKSVNKNSKIRKSVKSVSDEHEEIADPNCISYVKTCNYLFLVDNNNII